MNKLSWQSFLIGGGIVFMLIMLIYVFKSKQIEKLKLFLLILNILVCFLNIEFYILYKNIEKEKEKLQENEKFKNNYSYIFKCKHKIALQYFNMENGDLIIKDENDNYHLIRNGIDLTLGLKAKKVISFNHSDWAWMDEKYNWHYIIGGKK